MAEQLDFLAAGTAAAPSAPTPAAVLEATTRAEPRLILGDCFELMDAMAEHSVDAIVTDPPYGLEFMGKEWDRFRIDPRSARWASQSGAAGDFGVSMHGAVLPSYTRRRTTSQCRTCGKRDAFRNPHECDESGAADWATVYVDSVPVELRAFQNWCSEWGARAYRVLKPGGHLLAFGGPRTFHRLACGLEDVGFDIRDCLMWLYGSGFPKSLDVSKAIDKALGAEREPDEHTAPNYLNKVYGEGIGGVHTLSKGQPSTPEALKWGGWGTGLKPAWEPIVLARKPAEGTIAANLLKWGTGGLNIDGCRIAGESESVLGRWPANILLDAAAAAMLDEQVGRLHGAGNLRLRRDLSPEQQYQAARPGWVFGMPGSTLPSIVHDDGGAPSRFFYTGKASRSEREEGLQHHLEPQSREDVTGRQAGSAGGALARAGITAGGEIRNTHPTVKPVDLMRYLLRLVVPPGGVALDPFVGSGTTLVAAWEEGVDAIGHERLPEYHRIAAARLAEATRQGRLF